jgi:hypothetical protein
MEDQVVAENDALDASAERRLQWRIGAVCSLDD